MDNKTAFVDWGPLLEALPQGLLVADAAGRFVAANKGACRILGRDRQDLLSTGFFDPRWTILGPEGSPLLPEDFPGVLALREDAPQRQRLLGLVKEDGDTQWLEILAGPLPDEGVVVSFDDVTERHRAESILTARSRIRDMAAAGTLEEVLRAILDEAERLTGSCIGFLHFVDADQNTLTLQAWSTRTARDFCRAEGAGLHYPIDQAGVWVDAVRQRAAVIHNDYPSLPHRKGMPEGHAEVKRELVVPIFRGGLIVALLGVGNKPFRYGAVDVETVQQLADLAWDTAESKRAAGLLQFENAALEHSLNAVVLADLEGTLRFVNPAFVTLWGLKDRHQPLGSKAWDYWADPEAAKAVLLRVLTEGRPVEGELQALRKDGSLLDVHFTASMAMDASGRPLGVLGTFLDITDRKQTEVALKQSQGLLAKTFASLHDAIFILTADKAQIQDCNPVASKMFGYDRDEMLGRTTEFLHVDEAALEEFREHLQRALATQGRLQSFEFRMKRKDRTVFPTEHSVTRLEDEHGEALGWVSVVRDITERKAAEDRLRRSEAKFAKAFQSSPDLIVMTSLVDGRIFEVNERLQAITGYSRDDIIGRTTSELQMWVDPSQRDRYVAHLLREGFVRDWDVQFRFKSGRILDTLLSGEILDLQEGKCILGVIRDVTGQRLAEAALRRLTTSYAGLNGRAFFEAVSLDIATAMRLDYVFIGEPISGNRGVNVLGGCALGAPMGDLRYGLAGTPCENVMGNQLCIYPSRVQELFPEDALLVQMGIEAYVGSPLFDGNHQPIGILVGLHSRPIAHTETVSNYFNIFIDRISAEMQREKAIENLRESEATFRKLFEDSSDAILLIDATGVFVECNQSALDLLRMTREQFLLLPPARISPEFQPDGRRSAEAAPEMIAMAYSKGLHRFDWTCVNAEGGEFIVEVSLMPVTIKGQVMLHTTWRDITSRKQVEQELRISEEKFARAFRSSPDVLILSSLDDGRVVEVNDKVFTILGYTREEIIGRSTLDSGVWVDLQRRADIVARLMRDGMVRDMEIQLYTKSRAVIDALYSSEIIELQDGKYVHAVIRDITDRKRAEEVQHQLQAQLRQSQKMDSLGALAGGVAHDMNNVLGAILGLASANMRILTARSPMYSAFETISKAAERGGKMVKSLLGFARQSPVETRELDVNEILREEVGLLERTTLAKVRIALELAPDLRPILGDASALTHAFMNLCVNAVDAMPENGTLTLRTRNVDDGWIEVQVEDTGLGMPREVLEKALEPFFTTKPMGKGTGLGLSMVYGTVKAHQGHLEIQSEPGHGTLVRMRFPACLIVPAAHELAPEAASMPPSGALKVLLVDDDDLIRDSVGGILEVLGHAVTVASSGESALAQLQVGLQPDVVILDMNMPGLGGGGTLPQLRALRPLLPVLLATGRVDQEALDLVKAHPGVALLSKPFSLEELEMELKRLDRL